MIYQKKLKTKAKVLDFGFCYFFKVLKNITDFSTLMKNYMILQIKQAKTEPTIAHTKATGMAYKSFLTFVCEK